MGRFGYRVQAIALALGAPGLFVVAFLDSSLLSLPEVADFLVIWMVTHHKARLPLYVVAATAGSVLGCLLMYFLGNKGGEALCRRRFNSAAVDRVLAAFRRHGVMAVLIPSILPPPAPFKIFVLMAGVAGISVPRFTTAIVVGRGTRYLIAGLLAVRYGDRALAFIRAHGRMAAIAVVSVLVVGFVGYLLLWRKAATRTPQ